MSGARTLGSLEKKRRGWSCFPRCNSLRSRWARSEECVRAYHLAVRSHYCWGTAAIEIMGIAHGSGGWVGDGLALFPPALPRSSALSGRKLALQFFPLEWERANQQQFSLQRKCILFLFRVARVLQRQRVHYGHSQFIIWIFHIRPCLPCLGVCLHIILKN